MFFSFDMANNLGEGNSEFKTAELRLNIDFTLHSARGEMDG